MTESAPVHPLSVLPSEDQDNERVDSWNDMEARDYQASDESDLMGILKGRNDYLALSDDTNEVHFEALLNVNEDPSHLNAYQHAATPLDDSVVPLPTPPYQDSTNALTYDPPLTPEQDNESLHYSVMYTAQSEQDSRSWAPGDDIEIDTAVAFRRASLDVVIDFVPDTTPTYRHGDDFIGLDYHFSTEDDGDPHRTSLVRYSDAHNIVCTPPPPTPPPHRTNISVLSLPLSPPNASAFESYLSKPYGPRIPPWSSNENLNRERRLRTDIRVLGDRLEERFDEDSRRRVRDRQRKDEQLKKGIKRTEGEELRELVLGIYPEMDAEREERRGSCWCIVM